MSEKDLYQRYHTFKDGHISHVPLSASSANRAAPRGYDPRILPAPSTDPARLRRDLLTHGFCMVAGALSAAQLAAARRRAVSQAAAEEAAGVAHLESGVVAETHRGAGADKAGRAGAPPRRGPNQRVTNLLNKGAVFRGLATLDAAACVRGPLVERLLREMLGDGMLISVVQMNVAGRGGRRMLLHQDQGFMPLPHPPYPCYGNVLWCLDEYREENGGTLVSPGSHLRVGVGSPLAAADLPLVAVTAPAGTAVVLDGRIVHGTGTNTTAERRHGIIASYCAGFIRQADNPFLSVHQPESLSPKLRRLLGFEPHMGIGQVGDAVPELSVGMSVGEMRTAVAARARPKL